mgnify:CR=1 FL=1
MRLSTLVILLSTLLLLGCGGSSDNDESTSTSTIEILLDKRALSVAEQTEVNIGASVVASTSIVSTSWQQVSGSEVNLNIDQMGARFFAPIVLLTDGEQELVFRFTVTGQDDSVESADVTVTVTPVNQLPSVVTTVERNLDSEHIAKLTAIATDSDGDIVNYLWQQTAGETVDIEDYQRPRIQFSLNGLSSEILTFTITATDNEGESSVNELSINPTADIPNVVTSSEIFANSGATTLVEWQSIDNNNELNFEILQVTGEQTLVFNSLKAEGIYFDAPIVVGDAQTYQLSLSITDESTSQFNIPILLTVSPNMDSFADVETILSMSTTGIEVDEFSTQDIDNDGNTDIVAYHDKGVYWYKNYSDLAIESSPVYIYGKRMFRAMQQHFFKDVDDDNYVDFVFFDYDPQINNLIIKYKKNDSEGQFTPQFDIVELVGSGSSLYDAKLLIANQKTQQNLFSVITYSSRPKASKLFVVEQQGDDFVAHEPVVISGEILDVQNCQLPGVPETAMFFYVSENIEGNYSKSLFLTSSKDNYQSATLLSTDISYDANMLCYQLPDKSYRLFFNYGYSNSREIVYSDNTGYEELTIATGLTGGSEANFKLFDINHDGVDEVIKYGRWGSVSTVFSFDANSTNDLFIPIANVKLNTYSNKGLGKVTFWQESNGFHFFRENNNRFELSEKYFLGEPIDYQLTGYSFKAPHTIRNVSTFANDLVINTNLDNGKVYQNTTFSLSDLDYKLALNTVNNIENFGTQLPILVDYNGDNIKDAFYTSLDIDTNYFCNMYTSSVNVVVRLGLANGQFAEPESLDIVSGCLEGEIGVLIQDINLDGSLDIAVNNSGSDCFDSPCYIWNYTHWWLYDKDSYGYIKNNNDIFDDSLNNLNVHKKIGDISADGLSDVLLIDQPEFDYIQVGNDFLPGVKGIPSAYVALDDGSFTDLIAIDENLLFKFTTLADIDLDGSPDYLAHILSSVSESNGAEQVEEGIWYRWSDSGQFEKIEIPLVSKTYVDLNGDGNSYFVNNEQAGKLTKYRFDSKIGKPVIDEVIYNDVLPNNGKRLLIDVDVDSDNDLDVIFWDDQNVYMMRNLHH